MILQLKIANNELRNAKAMNNSRKKLKSHKIDQIKTKADDFE